MESLPKTSVFDGTGNAHSIAANRLSYFYNFKGPSIAIDTACSSSLVATHMACEHLVAGDTELALAAGVNLLLSPHLFDVFSKSGMLSPDGQCFTFSDQANGYVRGEGCGVVVLKRLDEALRDNNRIYATIDASSINQDGRTNGLTAPSGRAQIEVMSRALEKSSSSPQEMNWIEAHGTGTPLGDAIEYKSIDTVYGKRSQPVQLSSVKTNIGHLEAAAGIAGLIKTALSLHKRQLPPHLNYTAFNSNVEQNKNIHIPLKAYKYESQKQLQASVSSFGFGGANAHVIMKSNPQPTQKINFLNSKPQLKYNVLKISSSSKETLRALAAQHSQTFKNNPSLDLSSYASTSLFKRSHLD